jgi:hypothetical protein
MPDFSSTLSRKGPESDAFLAAFMGDASSDAWMVPYEVVMIYCGGGMNREGERLTKADAEELADRLRLQFAEVDDVACVFARPMDSEEEPPHA